MFLHRNKGWLFSFMICPSSIWISLNMCIIVHIIYIYICIPVYIYISLYIYIYIVYIYYIIYVYLLYMKVYICMYTYMVYMYTKHIYIYIYMYIYIYIVLSLSSIRKFWQSTLDPSAVSSDLRSRSTEETFEGGLRRRRRCGLSAPGDPRGTARDGPKEATDRKFTALKD